LLVEITQYSDGKNAELQVSERFEEDERKAVESGEKINLHNN